MPIPYVPQTRVRTFWSLNLSPFLRWAWIVRADAVESVPRPTNIPRNRPGSSGSPSKRPAKWLGETLRTCRKHLFDGRKQTPMRAAIETCATERHQDDDGIKGVPPEIDHMRPLGPTGDLRNTHDSEASGTDEKGFNARERPKKPVNDWDGLYFRHVGP